MTYSPSCILTRIKIRFKHLNTQQSVALLLGVFALIYAVLLFGINVKEGLRLFEIGDETEKFVAAKMLRHGQHLYRDVFAHHGPIAYMMAHFYTAVVSETDFSFIRLELAVLALASCFAISFSPILKNITTRIWAAALYLFILSSVWAVQSIHMLLYQQIGGFLFVIALSQMLIPALLAEPISKAGLFFSGFSLTLACFSAYAFGPAAVLFVASSTLALIATKQNLKIHASNFLLGSVLAIAIVVWWLIFFGDLLGYLIYHFYFNQEIYTHFIAFSTRQILNNLLFSTASDHIIQTLAVSFFGVWACALAFITLNKTATAKSFVLKSAAICLLFMAVLLVNPRGQYGFHNAGFVVLNFAAIALLAAFILQKQLSSLSVRSTVCALTCMVLFIFFVEYASKSAVSTMSGVTKKEYPLQLVDLKLSDDPVYHYIRSIVKDNETILSLPFNPILYVKANRLPASGHYYYLPWQATYNRAPLLDYKIDICNDIDIKKPPVIWFDDWRVWNHFSISEYEPCIPTILAKHYIQHPEDPSFFIRTDRIDFKKNQFNLRPNAIKNAVATDGGICVVDNINHLPIATAIHIKKTLPFGIEGWSIIDSKERPVPPLIFAVLINKTGQYYLEGKRKLRPDVSKGNTRIELAGFKMTGYFSKIPLGDYRLKIATGDNQSLVFCDTKTMLHIENQ